MKSYLQRLAARAEGVGLTPSLVPTGRSDTIQPADTDSFFAEAEPVVAGPTETQSRNAPIVSPLEAGQSVEPMPSKHRSQLTADLREEATEDAFGAETVLAQPKPSVRETASSLSESSRPPERKRDLERTDGPLTTTNPIEDRRADTSLGSLLTPRLRPEATEEPVASKDKLPVVLANKEPDAPLEPRFRETPPVPVSDEPRLVIGQLRVDVVATGQTQTREVVRVVSRSDGSNSRSRAASSISKLRFGLGQM